MKLAVLGGSFNPVHIGHLALVDAVHGELGYDRILLIPANIAPHKGAAPGATNEDRLRMLQASSCDEPWLAVDDCEMLRGGRSYTVDTLAFLTEKYKGQLESKIGFVIGEDLVDGFSSWKDPEGILSLADLIVARRPGCSVLPFSFPCTNLVNKLLPISSSEIREAIAAGKSWRYLVPESVYRYIVGHNLYEYGTN